MYTYLKITSLSFVQILLYLKNFLNGQAIGPCRNRISSRRELTLPSSHTTVRTDPYTAVHDHYDLIHTKVIIGIYPMDSITLFESPLCMQ